MQLFLGNKLLKQCSTKKIFENTRSIIKSLLCSRPPPANLLRNSFTKTWIRLQGLNGKGAVVLGKQVLMFDKKNI